MHGRIVRPCRDILAACALKASPVAELGPLLTIPADCFSLQAARASVVAAAAGRPIWYPGNQEQVPAYLDGSLPGE